jgi:hypothetical protein
MKPRVGSGPRTAGWEVHIYCFDKSWCNISLPTPLFHTCRNGNDSKECLARNRIGNTIFRNDSRECTSEDKSLYSESSRGTHGEKRSDRQACSFARFQLSVHDWLLRGKEVLDKLCLKL